MTDLFLTLSLASSHLLALMKQAIIHGDHVMSGGPRNKELRDAQANSQQGLISYLQLAPSNCIWHATTKGAWKQTLPQFYQKVTAATAAT